MYFRECVVICCSTTYFSRDAHRNLALAMFCGDPPDLSGTGKATFFGKYTRKGLTPELRCSRSFGLPPKADPPMAEHNAAEAFFHTYRGVAQLVERMAGGHEVARSSRVTPTRLDIESFRKDELL